MGKRLDSYGAYPSGMQEYLSMYGWHFSKRMYEWSISMLKRFNPATGRTEPLELHTKEQIDELIKKHNVTIPKIGYDYCYVVNEAKAIHWKIAIEDDVHLARYLRHQIDNVNTYEEAPFTRFYADCIAKGIPIMWEDML